MNMILQILKSQLLRRAVFVLGCLNVAFQLFGWLPFCWNTHDKTRDSFAYYEAARSIDLSLPLYHSLNWFTPITSPSGYVYWPQLAVLISPLGYLNPIAFCRVWYLILLACFWIFAASLGKIAQRRLTLDGVLTWGLVLGVTPKVYLILALGNADPIIWALFGLALCTPATQPLFAAIAQIKTYGIPVLAMHIWSTRRIERQTALVLAVGIALSLHCGWKWPVVWIQNIAPVAHQGTFLDGNLSFSMLLLRFARLDGWHYAGGVLPHWAQFTLIITTVIFELLSFIICTKLNLRYRYAVLLLLSALSQPLCWGFYIVCGYTVVALLINDLNAKYNLVNDSP